MADINENNANNNVKFALDIGTRTVIGMILSKDGRNLVVEDYELMEHPDRAMYDGQVHDIFEVSEIVKKIKNTLEQRNNITLTNASIAAAGRSLKTEKVVLEKRLDPSEEITQEFLDSIEMEAIQLAGDKIKKSVPVVKTLYYCVGYSTVGILLDDVNVKNPVGHSASTIKYGLVATFLPHNVSDTLYKVVINAGLNIESMTLEPIAALEVSLRNTLRLLNLAIIDIGAGTSDIALTKSGNIYSYGMVDVAGDEISEALMREFLLDFDEAEQLKLNLMNSDEQEFKDIIGVTHKVKTGDIINKISTSLDAIAEKIAECVLEENKEVPDAVFLIGGSSQMPSLKDRIARALGIDENKINVKKANDLKHVDYKIEPLNSPEFVTPIGIGYMSYFVKQRDFISIVINSKVYRLFNRKNLSISDALVLAGFNAKRLIQTRGKSMKYILNGEEKTIHGGAGEPSKIILNGLTSSMYDSIKHMDIIEITKPIGGEDASAELKDVVNFDAYVLKNKEKIPFIEKVFINGKEETDKNYLIKEGDIIETVSVDGEYEEVSDKKERLEKKPISSYREDDYSKYLENEDDFDDDISEVYDYKAAKEELIKSQNPKQEIEDDDSRVLNLLINARALKIKVKKETYLLSDLLKLLNYDIEKYGDKIAVKVNGKDVEHNSKIVDGDKIELGFK